MEDAFEKLKKEGKNSADHLVRWLEDAKVIDKDTEKKVKKLFEGATDTTNIDYGHFKNAITKLAEEQQKTTEDLSQSLVEKAPKFLEAVKAAATAFKETINKK